MSAAAKSLATLGTLVGLVVLATAWGWSALTQPLPGGPTLEEEATPDGCIERTVTAGDRVRTGEVTVSVFNAGGRTGAANDALQLLSERGFAEGRTGNAPSGTGVRFVRIWADDPSNPAVRLVARHLGGPEISPNEGIDAPGVIVLVGNDFAGLEDAPRRVRVRDDAIICGPSLD